MYYSTEIGPFSQSKISSILKSKFKAKKTKPSIKRKTTRCVEFKKEYLDRIKSSYNIPKKIQILGQDSKSADSADTNIENMDYSGVYPPDDNIENDVNITQKLAEIDENTSNFDEKSIIEPIAGSTNNPEYDKLLSAPSASESPSEPEKPEECPKCNEMVEPFDKNTHPACCKGNGVGIG
jgi:hypothetical protein